MSTFFLSLLRWESSRKSGSHHSEIIWRPLTAQLCGRVRASIPWVPAHQRGDPFPSASLPPFPLFPSAFQPESHSADNAPCLLFWQSWVPSLPTSWLSHHCLEQCSWPVYVHEVPFPFDGLEKETNIYELCDADRWSWSGKVGRKGLPTASFFLWYKNTNIPASSCTNGMIHPTWCIQWAILGQGTSYMHTTKSASSDTVLLVVQLPLYMAHGPWYSLQQIRSEYHLHLKINPATACCIVTIS